MVSMAAMDYADLVPCGATKQKKPSCVSDSVKSAAPR